MEALKLIQTATEEIRFWSYRALGMRVDCVHIPDAIKIAERWIEENQGCHFITFSGMHGAVESQQNEALKNAYEAADLNVPDGMPLVWLARLHGITQDRRCYGPEFLEEFCKKTGPKYRHFFFGSTPEVLERMTTNLRFKYQITVAGSYSPPFRALSVAEQNSMIEQINAMRADIIWIGLGCPKQEMWVHEHRDKLKIPCAAAVGAAFDFHAGTKAQAPKWMRENGLEWFFRLMTEPRRLWKRYLLYGMKFATMLVFEFMRSKKPS